MNQASFPHIEDTTCSTFLLREGIVSVVEAGVLTCNRHVLMLRPLTVAAQCWICTSFHLYALASGLAGRLDKAELCNVHCQNYERL
jgi:hypothetical protein